MPNTPCLTEKCGNFATYRGRCAIHSKDRERETHRTGRLTPTSGRMYGLRRWIMLRRRRLFLDPLCAWCGDIAAEVDHVTPIEQGGAPWDLANTQSMCKACHSAKTRREQREAVDTRR